MTQLHMTIRRFALTLVGGLFAIGVAQAGSAPADAQARYQQEMAFCNSGKSSQDLNTCRTEARNALAEAKRGGLNDDAPDQYNRNAVRRCTQFQGDDRTACEARVLNPSRVDGSVAGGGILRESVIVIPAQ